jgi:hypothetical protein
MILGVRVLLIALLLIGSTGSALCQSLCAQPSDLQAAAHAAETAGPVHGGCHSGGVSSPVPLTEQPGHACVGGCCTVLTRAAVDSTFSPGPAPADSPMPAGADLHESCIRPALLRHSQPVGPFESPFRFRNPPLLI